MADNANAQDPRDIVEAVTKELEQDQPKPEAEQPKPEVAPEAKKLGAEPKPEAKADTPTDPKPDTEEKKPERPERKPQYVPVTKANQWRHEANEAKARTAELERQIAELKAGKADPGAKPADHAPDLDAIAKEIAGEEASPAVVKKILEKARELMPRAAEPSSDLKALLSLKETLDKQAEEAGFQTELTQTLTKFPELKGHESELREMAYAEGNEKIPLHYLARALRDDLNLSPAPPSAEGKGTTPKAGELDFGNMSEKDILALEGEDFDKYLAWQTSGVRKRTGVRL